ncbi:hypothetical protein [Siccirubricoccus phaeus]|uniref:hypothetical protein n=1 Tax=Siccirubricoccus phaeus TaxID=2595053 RepID=UPI0011F2D601|nr:hypothetical protein [Siccirubricoccus phaeus]
MRRRVLALAAGLAMAAGAAMAEPGEILGAWSGTYDCAQGLTGVTLTIAEAGRAHARALFHFYADPRNPRVPTGCFTMDGSYDAKTGALVLHGRDWLLRPSGYVVVDFLGRVDPAGREFSGRVQGPHCGSFRLERRAAAKVPAACGLVS